MSPSNTSGRLPSNAARACGRTCTPSSRKRAIPATGSSGHVSPRSSSGSTEVTGTTVAPVAPTDDANAEGLVTLTRWPDDVHGFPPQQPGGPGNTPTIELIV